MIYLDNSATTKIDPEVKRIMDDVSEKFFANPSSIHGLGGEVEKLLREARETAGRCLGIPASSVIFTSGGTEGNNLIVKGIAIERRHRGKHLITTQIEHPSVYESFEQLERFGFEVTYLPVDSRGLVDPEDLRKALTPETTLVSIMAVNNEVGVIQPLEALGAVIREHSRAAFHVDAVQALGKMSLPLQAWGINAATFSSHKIHGPKGVGLVYLAPNIAIEPLLVGGGQQEGKRPGTENVPGIVGMVKALQISVQHLEENIAHLAQMNQALRQGIETIEGAVIHGPVEQERSAPHILNFSIPKIKTEVLIHALEEKGIVVSTRSACSSKKQDMSRVMRAMGVSPELAQSSIRVSLSPKNHLIEAEQLVQTLKAVVPEIKRVMKV
jgi:cysteine desulfurase